MRGRRQNWRPVGRRLLLLDFQLGGEDSRRGGGNGNETRFGATVAVDDFRRIACSDDLCESGEWSTDDVDAADQLIRTAVGENFVHDQGQDLESLRLAASG